MDAKVKTISELMVGDIRLLVPRYQRPYVWNEERHWDPLWEDVLACAGSLSKGVERDHFLGAIVLQQEHSPPGEPARHQVIDGQQRLTTTQILLAAITNMASACDQEKTARQLEKLVLNDPDVAEGDSRFKLWPTQADRTAYRLVASPGGPALDAEDDPSNTIQEAYDYFRRQVGEFAVGDGSDAELIGTRLDQLRIVVGHMFKFVAISLEEGDEAQVIFETLNARGTPLLALDLVKNAVFLQAEQAGENTAELHDELWEEELGSPYWREEIRQGRLNRPRAELFLMHWMTMKLALRGDLKDPIRSDMLFKVFGSAFLKDPTIAPGALIRELVRDAKVMRSLDSVSPGTPEGRYFRTVAYLDSSLFLPLVLYLYTTEGITEEDRQQSLGVLESFQLRRALLSQAGKSYSQVVIEILRALGQADGSSAKAIGIFLASSDASRSYWPRDKDLRERLLERPIYGWVSRQKVTGVLAEVEFDLRGDAKTEDIALLDHSLSIEHILPQKWEKNWPLEDSSAEAEDRRNEALHVLGNLTLATGSLNGSLSNQAWAKKKERMADHSLLLLNRRIAKNEKWNEKTIKARGKMLADRIVELWPGPLEPDVRADISLGFDTAAADENEDDSISETLVATLFSGGSEKFKMLLRDLADRPSEKRSFGELEAVLGWSTGTLAGVLGGFATHNPSANEHRPFHTDQDLTGTWWIWADEIQAAAISDAVDSSKEDDHV